MGTITGEEDVGGLVGLNLEDGALEHSYSTATISARNNVGSLAGENQGTIKNSYASSNILATGNNVGGLAGYNSGEISNVYYKGTKLTLN